jgi:hypothetical protein
MKNHFLSRFEPENIRRTIIYSVLALSLLIISLVFGVETNGWLTLMFFVGVAFLFYAALRLWANAKYYGIMCIIIIAFFTLYITVGIDILTKMQANKDLVKSIGEYLAFIGPIGLIVGIIGFSRFKK